MKTTKLAKSMILMGIAVFTGIAASCSTTIKPKVSTGYDWAGTNKILVVGVSELERSEEISRALTHRLFENGLPVEHIDTRSVLDIYDAAHQMGADVVAYGQISRVEVYYPYFRSDNRFSYPTKTVDIELQFIETETRRKIWTGSGSLEDNASVADEFLVDRLLAEMVEKIIPQWKEIPRSSTELPMLKAGEKAPRFEIKDLNGDSYALKSDLGRRIIVLNFWSFFCDLCREQIRLLDEVQQRFDGKDVIIIAVNIDGGGLADRISTFVDESGYRLKFLMDEHSDDGYEAADSYRVPGTPALYVIGKSGLVAFSRSGHLTKSELTGVLESQLRQD